MEGFNNLIVGEVQRRADFKRLAWIQFQNQQLANKALQKLKQNPTVIKQITLEFTKACKRLSKIKIINNYPISERLSHDLEAIEQICSKLDNEAKIYSQNNLRNYKFRSLKEKFQLYLLYLRRVHFFEYFQGKFYDSYRSLSVRSGLALLIVYADKKQNKLQVQSMNCEDQPILQQSKLQNSSKHISTQQLSKLDKKLLVIKQQGSLVHRKRQQQNISIFSQLLKLHLYKIQNFNSQTDPVPKYWRCSECRKKFLTMDHLIKHTVSRHEQWIEDLIAQAQWKIYLKEEEEYQKTKQQRGSKEDKLKSNRKKRFLIDFDDPQEQEQMQIKDRLRPVSNSRKLINFLDI